MSDAPNKPLNLDYARHTYFTLSTAAPTPPTLPAPSSSSSLASKKAPRLMYIGPVGPGIMANEHVVALEGVGSGTSEAAQVQVVEEARRSLKGVEGVKHVELMQPKMRSKR